MAIKDVLIMGNPLLNQPAKAVEDIHSPAVKDVIQDMFDTMHHYGGIGIAAPQIGIPLRIMIFGFEKSERYPDAEPVPTTVIINPEFKPIDQTTIPGWEGCLSVPGLRGVVERFKAIEYQGYSPEGKLIQVTAEGMHARVFQHELDHLDGILFPMRIHDMRLLGFESEVWDMVINRDIPVF